MWTISELTGSYKKGLFSLSWLQFSSVTQSCPALCDRMNCSTPGFPVHHKLPRLAQTHVHWVDDAIQPSHPLSPPSPPTFNLFQRQGLFAMSQFFASGGQSVGASASASVFPMNIQDGFPLGLTSLISLLSMNSMKRVSSKSPYLPIHPTPLPFPIWYPYTCLSVLCVSISALQIGSSAPFF